MNKFRQRLSVLGYVPSWPAWFDLFLEKLKEYKKERGHCQVPKSYKCPEDGYHLGERVMVVRSAKRGKGNVTLTDEMTKELDAIGFVWDPREWFPEFLEKLKEYKKERGHCQVPKSYKCPEDGYKLGGRVDNVRQAKRDKGRLKIAPEMIKELDAIGIVWDPREWFPEFLVRLREYKREHGHCQVPTSYKWPEDGYHLGERVRGVRSAKRGKGTVILTDEMTKELDAIGFVWDPKEWFPEFLVRLKEYKKEHGDYQVPTSYKCPEDGYKLGTRVKGVRQAKRGIGRIKVTPEMIKELDAIGFVWEVIRA